MQYKYIMYYSIWYQINFNIILICLILLICYTCDTYCMNLISCFAFFDSTSVESNPFCSTAIVVQPPTATPHSPKRLVVAANICSECSAIRFPQNPYTYSNKSQTHTQTHQKSSKKRISPHNQKNGRKRITESKMLYNWCAHGVSYTITMLSNLNEL